MLVPTVRRAHRTSHLTRGSGRRTPGCDRLRRVQRNSHAHADDQPLVRSSGWRKTGCGLSSIASSEYKGLSDLFPAVSHFALIET